MKLDEFFQKHKILSLSGAVLMTVISLRSCALAVFNGGARNGSASPISDGSKAVEIVRQGVLPNYPATTMGKALEGTFQNVRWSSAETTKAVKVVHFDGTIPYTDLKLGFSQQPYSFELAHQAEIRKACPNDPIGEGRQMQIPDDPPTCIKNWGKTALVPVSVTFVINADNETFNITSVYNGEFAPDLKPFLQFIYH